MHFTGKTLFAKIKNKKATTLECTLIAIFHKRNKNDMVLFKKKPTPCTLGLSPYSLRLSHNEFWLLPKSNPPLIMQSWGPWGYGKEHASDLRDFQQSSGQSHRNGWNECVASQGHHAHQLHAPGAFVFLFLFLFYTFIGV